MVRCFTSLLACAHSPQDSCMEAVLFGRKVACCCLGTCQGYLHQQVVDAPEVAHILQRSDKVRKDQLLSSLQATEQVSSLGMGQVSVKAVRLLPSSGRNMPEVAVQPALFGCLSQMICAMMLSETFQMWVPRTSRFSQRYATQFPASSGMLELLCVGCGLECDLYDRRLSFLTLQCILKLCLHAKREKSGSTWSSCVCRPASHR